MRKNKKKKDNLRRNLVLFGFLLIIVSFIDTRVDKKDISLIAINEEENYTNVNAKELLSVLDKETAVVLVIDDKRYNN